MFRAIALLQFGALLLGGFVARADAQVTEKASGAEAINTLTPEERAAGWRLLFDGETTAGWRGFKSDSIPSGWQVVDGSLTRVAPAGDLITVEQFESFELELEWQVEPGGNSGVFFHVMETDGSQYVYETGPEMQVLDNARHADGQQPETSAGSNFALHGPVRDVSRPAGEWNQARLVVDGTRVEHWLNGVKIVDYELYSPDWEERVAASKFGAMEDYGRFRSGHIALQDHGDRVAYRNIKIRVLPAGR